MTIVSWPVSSLSVSTITCSICREEISSDGISAIGHDSHGKQVFACAAHVTPAGSQILIRRWLELTAEQGSILGKENVA